jgi:superfamily II DNA or RNA helicase
VSHALYPRDGSPGLARVLIEAATGTGKGTLIVGIAVLLVWAAAHRVREKLPGARQKRVLLLAHRDELIQELVDRVKKIHGHPRVGVVKAERSEWLNPIVVGSVQSLTVARMANAGAFDLVIRDEAHHAVSPTDMAIFDEVLRVNPDAKIVGVTATPYQSAPKGKTRGLGKAFTEIVYRYGLADAIEAGDLVPIIGKAVPIDVSLEGCRHTKDGDINEDDAADRINFPERNDVVVAKYKEHCQGKPALVFCCNVRHCKDMAERFKLAGIPAEAVWGDMRRDQRKRLIAKYREHPDQLPVLCSNDLIREGFDAPETYAVLKARPTESMVVFVQMVGRGTRVVGVPHGLTDPAEKRAAIATSRKPHLLFIDFTYGGCALDLSKAMANLDEDEPIGRPGRGFDVGDEVMRRHNDDWGRGIVRAIDLDAKPRKATVRWPPSQVHPGGAELTHPISALRRPPPDAEEAEAEQATLVPRVTGIREYEIVLLPGQRATDPGVIGWYEWEDTFTVGAKADGVGHIRMHVREGKQGWEVWSIRPPIAAKGETGDDIATRRRGDCESKEVALAWANAHLSAHRAIVAPLDAEWRDQPASAGQKGILRSLQIRRDLSDMSSGEADALIDAIKARRRVAEVLDPGLAHRRKYALKQRASAGRAVATHA